ncbi:MAG: hypothetical protein CM15mP18_3050 [Methanobacteriota archaeon]|nr:MAG: hypothetical protein CM15mP18_3050 [Euryarchaeota archaeon]
MDAHCVLPRPVFGRGGEPPFRFKDATKREMKRRMGQPWPRCTANLEPLSPLGRLHSAGRCGCGTPQGRCRLAVGHVPDRSKRGPSRWHDRRRIGRMARWASYLNEGV